MKPRHLIQNEKGFTLVEIIAVLVVLGILAAVAIPKYMDVTTQARTKAAQGQIAEAKGRLSTALAGYMIANNGDSPTDGAALLTYANNTAVFTTASCPTAAPQVDADFTWQCAAGTGKAVTITVSVVQNATLTPNATGSYTFN